jgi:hypothetical protein
MRVFSVVVIVVILYLLIASISSSIISLTYLLRDVAGTAGAHPLRDE